MSKALRSYRLVAALRQSNRCYYCGVPMWEHIPPRQLMQFAESARQANRLRCTGEHLLPRAEGGPNAACNIVAACAFCNRSRHQAKRPLEPNEYRQHVRSQMVKGCWHPNWVHHFAAAFTLK
jgi:hypothetical protein